MAILTLTPLPTLFRHAPFLNQLLMAAFTASSRFIRIAPFSQTDHSVQIFASKKYVFEARADLPRRKVFEALAYSCLKIENLQILRPAAFSVLGHPFPSVGDGPPERHEVRAAKFQSQGADTRKPPPKVGGSTFGSVFSNSRLAKGLC